MIRQIWRYLRKNGMMKTYYKIKEKIIGRIYYFFWKKKHLKKGLRKMDFSYMPLISILVPTYNTPPKYLEEMIESVIKQGYINWELCIADGSTAAETIKILSLYEKKDHRIRVRYLHENHGIAVNSNEALSMARGEYVGLLDHDDILQADALYWMIKAINERDFPEFLYSDEDKINSNGSERFDPHFKMEFSPDSLRSHNYICHFTMIKKVLLENHKICFNSLYDGAQDYDLFLQCIEKTKKIVHVKEILYHWRVHKGSTAGNSGQAKPYTHEAGRKALTAHLKRMGLPGTVLDGGYQRELSNVYHIQYAIQGNPKISIVLYDGKKKNADICMNILRSQLSGYSIEFVFLEKWEDISSLKCHGDYILFLEIGLRPMQQGWLIELVGLCQLPHVGIVGAKVYSKRKKIESAGLCREKGRIKKCYDGADYRQDGYMMRLVSIQNVDAVSSQAMVIPRLLWENNYKVYEMMEKIEADWNLCQQIKKMGYFVVFQPYAEMVRYDRR